MSRSKERIIWILYAAFLVFLFLLSSTNLIIKEQEHEVYRLSVIVEDERDDNYINFRKGMDLAASEHNADVSFITLYEKDHARQQMDMMLREQQDDAGALIVSPVDVKAVLEAVGTDQIQIPVVFLNAEQAGGQIAASITTDYEAMGKLLAEQVAARHGNETPVYLFGEPQRNSMATRFETGIRTELEARGYEVTAYGRQDDRSYRRAIEELVYPGCDNAVIIALEPESLSETAAILSDSSVYASYVEGLYGRGTNLSILNDLDRGLIRGVCVTDDFAAGYQSVEIAVELIRHQGSVRKLAEQAFYYIEKEDLRLPEYEKMLYPIE